MGWRGGNFFDSISLSLTRLSQDDLNPDVAGPIIRFIIIIIIRSGN